MSENVNYDNRPVELSITDLFWSILIRWRAILACILILGIVLGGYAFAKEYKKYANKTDREKRQAQYESSLADYDAKKENLEVGIANLEKRLEFLEHARENSLMLKIDPNNVYRIISIYYVDSDYEIMPETVYQNPDYTNALVKGYRNAVQRIDYNALVRMSQDEEDLFADPPIATQTVKRVYSAGIDESANLITIIVFADTEERADHIMEGIQSAITEATKTLATTVGSHSITKVSEVKDCVIDPDLYKSQAEFQDEYDKVVTALANSKAENSKLSKPTSTVISKKNVIKKTIKFGVIGLALGAILSLLYFGLRLIMQDKLKSTEELASRYALPVLGTFKQGEGKAGKLDKIISSALGLANATSEDAIKYIASNVALRSDNAKKVLLLGNTAKDNLEKIAEMLKPVMGDREIIVGGSVKNDASAISALSDDCAVVCVEDLQKTSHIDILNELKTVDASKSDKVGFVVLG